eukprot:SAG31_NODE_31477_length_367_cov_1.899254_2_plen_54_part_01
MYAALVKSEQCHQWQSTSTPRGLPPAAARRHHQQAIRQFDTGIPRPGARAVPIR